jgi:fumarate hydratase class I
MLIVYVVYNTGKKGQYVWTEGSDARALSRGIYNTYTQKNLRYSQVFYYTIHLRVSFLTCEQHFWY